MTLIAFLVILPFSILTLAFAIEVLLGLWGGRRAETPHSNPRSVVVMPANDEAKIIGGTLAAFKSQFGPDARILVVADNCHDDTAAIARAGGAEVIERIDASRRGKGYALAFARDHLKATPPDCVIVLDADCAIDRASMRAIASRAQASGRPVQAISLLRPDLAASTMVQVSNFAFAVKNQLRQRGAAMLSGRVNLTGTGMAFPWPLFSTAPLATGDQVEDLVLGLELSSRGAAPLLAPDAFVWSESSSAGGTLKQRTRWEGGFVSTSMRHALPTVGRAILDRNPRLFWAGLSLAIPPLTLLMLGNIVVLALVGLLTAAGASLFPLIAQTCVSALAAASILVAWLKIGRPYLSALSLLKMPFYLLWKLPLYVRLLRGGPKGWIRPGR